MGRIMYLGPYFPVYTKINFSWILHVNIESKTTKL